MSFRSGAKSEVLKNVITSRVCITTKCIKLAALNIHCTLSDIVQNQTDHQINEYFGQYVDRNFFDDFFRGIEWIGRDPVEVENSGYILHRRINSLCQNYNVTPVTIRSFSNIINYASQTYHTNFKNNIWMHAKSRIKMFCKAHNRNKKIVNDTVHYLFYTNSTKIPNAQIINAIRRDLRPNQFNIDNEKGYFMNINSSKWFTFVPMFMRLQG